ncbi:MAG TPA: hypothetical protein VK081_09700, partial [Planctomycetota bacterium]|nr:hypothetical protein [Planctomycetota bacterium]
PALAVRAQDGDAQNGEVDWAAKVKAAIESPRYAIQRAASQQIARAGDPAVPAIRAYVAEHGKDRIPMLLADALASGEGDGEATRALLREWADDVEFFWRAQALTGLARRKSAADGERFAAALRDPSHLYRVAGAKGVHALATASGKPWDEARAVLADPDPRARVLFALHLWTTAREPAALPVLVAAIADDRAFLDDDWGRRYAVQAVAALAKVAGTDFGYRATEPLAANAEAIARFAAWAEVEVPPLRERDAVADLGGVEIRSCRHGDLFVRWTEGEVHFGLSREHRVTLGEDAWARIDARLDALGGGEARQVLGAVVCDFVQLTTREPVRLWKAAPGALPEPVCALLEVLAEEVAAAGKEDLAGALRTRLPQFRGTK